MISSDPVSPPVWFASFGEVSPFELPLEIHNHTVAGPVVPGRRDTLTRPALTASVVSWWSRPLPSLIHGALRCGADPTDIATASGLDAGEVVRQWRRWTDVQRALDIGGRPAMDTAGVPAIDRRLGAEVDW